MRTLPDEICRLGALVSLRVASNKLVEMPLGFSGLERLEYLDLSYNRLTKFANLELRRMSKLKQLNVQHNKVVNWSEIRGWVFRNLEGNDDDSTRTVSSNESRTCEKGASDIVVHHDDVVNKCLSGKTGSGNLLSNGGDEDNEFTFVSCSSNGLDSSPRSEWGIKECSEHESVKEDEGTSSEPQKSAHCAKRRVNSDLDNPKPCKYRKLFVDASYLSRKYSELSFCSAEDYLQDGFYDAGRNHPFSSLSSYELNLDLNSREVILLDREKDELLDAITRTAQAFVSFHSERLSGETAVDNLKIASLLSLLVSDHFGGSDNYSVVGKMQKLKAVSSSNYRKPFVCTCSTGNNDDKMLLTDPTVGNLEAHTSVSDLCEKYIRSIKVVRKSAIVPIGTLQFGVCRHRALLMKYLCDVWIQKYLRADSWVRMIIDPCHPHDIREETDPEYFCRYIPLSRTIIPLSNESRVRYSCNFPSLSTGEEIVKGPFSSLIRYQLGSVEAVEKVRTLEVYSNSVDGIVHFVGSCIGEVRILGSLKHPCIVEFYGHQISSKWVPSEEGKPENSNIIQSAILMEDVASALAELHSKHIIHRDIKSENVLINLDTKSGDGTPLVKLCDFDTAVPLRSSLHTCCIAHRGIPPPSVCVGTLRWMAPEVMRARGIEPSRYGLEVDIWSFGCLLFELLTLQVPYLGHSLWKMTNSITMGIRPPLTGELEVLLSRNEPELAQSGIELGASETDSETMRFLADLFNHCTEAKPTDRPTAQNIHKMLLLHRQC
ncbi:Kinase and exchange factor for Rac B [Morella rubra]|uniref:Kinase and exchange factor for Rac B n=1 Tax=Morella rubra TaxID=262757 RepID=A0A6A1WBA4_9ROSI|nr:Kinase and exchange factor for Rac B [Morella rubra]